MKENRRSRRILASVQLEIHCNGQSRVALTAVINLNGALILCPVNWPAGTKLDIKNRDTGQEVHARVVWSGNQDSNGSHKLGVEFEASSPKFWAEQYDPKGQEAS